MIRNPSLRSFFCSEARHQRGVFARHEDFDSIGGIFLSNDPVGSAGARMFSCHPPDMVFDCGKAKKTLDLKARRVFEAGLRAWRRPMPSSIF
jgi:hypothetical protein